MIKVAIAGASGYTGAELIRHLAKHKNVTVTHLFVSEGSEDKGSWICEVHGSLRGQCELQLEPLDLERASALTSEDCDVIFLATDHKVSHDLAPIFIDNGIVVIDLSGAFRISDLETAQRCYGFEFGRRQKELMKERVYGLVDWVKPEELQVSSLISMPGCYPTASELALKPLTHAGLLDSSMPAVINAVSGVSGAGRKARLSNSFCEVSLNSYGLFTHRHQPEIVEYVGCDVIFNPHLGDFKRGILATITARLKDGVSAEDIEAAYARAYPKCSYRQSALDARARGNAGDAEYYESLSTLVRVRKDTVKLHDVQHTPFCDISFVTSGGYIVINSAIDNLLKGAATQAIEAMNLHFGLPRTRCLL